MAKADLSGFSYLATSVTSKFYYLNLKTNYIFSNVFLPHLTIFIELYVYIWWILVIGNVQIFKVLIKYIKYVTHIVYMQSRYMYKYVKNIILISLYIFT